MTKPKIHLLGLIMPYHGVGSCSAKKYKILKIDALYTGAARHPTPPHPRPVPCTTLCGCPWLAPALSTYSSNGDNSRVLTWRSQHLHSSSNSQFPTSPGLSSELQTPRVTRHGSFLLSLPLRGPPRRIPQPRIWASPASPTGLQFGGLYLLHSTVLPTTSPLFFPKDRVHDSSLPHKSIPEGSWLDSRELESGSPPKERPRPRSAPPDHASGGRERGAGPRESPPGA